MNFAKIKYTGLTVLAAAGFMAALPAVHAQPYARHTNVVAVAPGLTITLNNRDFDDRWHHSDVRQRGAFCHDVRRSCEIDGRHSRSCDLKWKYCTPQGHDYGYYTNH